MEETDKDFHSAIQNRDLNRMVGNYVNHTLLETHQNLNIIIQYV